MMTLHASREGLREVLSGLAAEIEGMPVYRSLNGHSFDEYVHDGVMTPKDGSYSVGRGVFFYLDPDSVVAENGDIIIIGSVESLSRGRRLIDTRTEGFDCSAGNVYEKDGWELWYDVLRDDTITLIPGRSGGIPVYTRRTPITREEILFEVVVDQPQGNFS